MRPWRWSWPSRVAAGEFVAIAGDRVPVSSARSVRAEFLGQPAAFPIGPYVLASAIGCPMFAMACTHEGDGYRIGFEQFSERVVLPRNARDAALSEQAARFAHWLEEQVRHAPSTGSTFSRSGTRIHMTLPLVEPAPLSFGDGPLSIEDVTALARRERGAMLSADPAFRAAHRARRRVPRPAAARGRRGLWRDHRLRRFVHGGHSARPGVGVAAPPVRLPRLRPGPLPRRSRDARGAGDAPGLAVAGHVGRQPARCSKAWSALLSTTSCR